jgi:hypothetical protein
LRFGSFLGYVVAWLQLRTCEFPATKWSVFIPVAAVPSPISGAALENL